MISKNKIVKLYKQGLSGREVAEKLKCGKSYALKIIKQFGASRPRKPRLHILLAKCHICKPFCNEFVNYLNGLMISDGSLSRPKGCSIGCYYAQYCINLEWLECVKKTFLINGVDGKIDVEKRKNRGGGGFVFRTPCYDQLGIIRRQWYSVDGKKVPVSLDFSDKLFLKNWIYGDGTLVNNSTLRLCTDSFCEDDVDYLISELNSTLDVNFRKCYMGKRKDGGDKYRPSLCIRDGLMKLYEYIGRCDVDCFGYKWRSVL